ncbi:MAG: DUF1049 domain-containing protein [Plectolyngbya sp. WJT66-NPBG17]|jgi:uncharacterized integral membrane protein|nr:DUF1049 domain-containing protein [Plectolyngbya sp. WJT66-NPBG17]MBW4526376.1 DUF1049 domain-containing protein [Phormidium tanganyikae FI6-MK23]
MRSFATLITACIVAVWIGAISLIAVQNAAPIALKFLAFQTIELPFGLVIAFSVMLGILGTAIAQPLLGLLPNQNDDV